VQFDHFAGEADPFLIVGNRKNGQRLARPYQVDDGMLGGLLKRRGGLVQQKDLAIEEQGGKVAKVCRW
jgi:hypothetical protein